MTNKPLTTAEIAEYCHVSNRAVLKWIAEGKLKAYRTPGMHARVNVQDFLNFLKLYHFPVPDALAALVSHHRILLVDDDRELVGLIKRILQLDKEFEVDVAYDGFMAGKKFAEFKPDILILDLMMPQMDGFEVLKMLRADISLKHVKVITVSGADHELLEKSKLLGADDALAKPFDHRVLINKIKSLLGMTALLS